MVAAACSYQRWPSAEQDTPQEIYIIAIKLALVSLLRVLLVTSKLPAIVVVAADLHVLCSEPQRMVLSERSQNGSGGATPPSTAAPPPPPPSNQARRRTAAAKTEENGRRNVQLPAHLPPRRRRPTQ